MDKPYNPAPQEIGPNYKKYILEKIRERSSMVIPEPLTERTTISVEDEYLQRGTLAHFESILYKQKMPSVELKVSTWKSWVDAFNDQVMNGHVASVISEIVPEDWAPDVLGWIEENFPVEMDVERETYEVSTVYPTLDIGAPEQDHYITVEKSTGR